MRHCVFSDTISGKRHCFGLLYLRLSPGRRVADLICQYSIESLNMWFTDVSQNKCQDAYLKMYYKAFGSWLHLDALEELAAFPQTL